MDREVFARPDVVTKSQHNFVPVKIRSDEREDLIAQFAIAGLPATVILKPTGEILAKREGFVEPAAFLELLESAQPAPAPSANLALAGYCPVSLVEGRGLHAGRADVSVNHDGLIYRFAARPLRDLFLKDPERFLPRGSGRCVVSLIDQNSALPGDPRYGVYYQDRLYLCSSAENQRRFMQNPTRYADADLADEGYCPHCRKAAGQKVRGLAQYSATRSGRRYLFPDPVHLEAFRVSPEKYLR
jgi:YHS domain-containing protein